jgi:ABC-type lipoprotein release transport system permease subunit
MFQYALISLARRWRKQVALVIIFSLVVAFFSSIVFLVNSLRLETKLVLQHIPQLWIQKLAGGRLEPINQAFIDSLQGIRGVQKVYPRIWGYNFDAPTGGVFTVIGSDSSLSDLKMIQTAHKQALSHQEAIVGTGFLALRGLQIGESLTLLDSQGKINSFKIVGSFQTNSDLLTKDLIVLSGASARKILGLNPQQCTDIALEIANDKEVDNIGRKIERKFAGLRIVSSQQLANTYETLFGWRGGIFVYGSLMALLAFMILAWERANSLSGEERQELGILKAVGWQVSEIIWMKFWEGLIISLTATLVGILLALIHVYIWQAPLFKPFMVGWSVVYPDFQLIPTIDFESLWLIVSFSLLPYLAATIIPAWRGAIIEPSEIMQG